MNQKSKVGFTLIELLMVIAIIGILTGLSLLVLADSAKNAKISRTKTQVRKLNNLILDRWESFETRRMPFRLSGGAVATREPKNASRIRLYAMRVIQRMEMPDRMSDIIAVDPGVNLTDVIAVTDLQSLTDFYSERDTFGNLVNPIDVPLVAGGTYTLPLATFENSLNNFYFRQIQSVVIARSTTANPMTWGELIANQGPECLYMILTSIQDEFGNALEQFSDIGDFDNDGLQEIHDSWGTPINFLRWAPGISETGAPSTTGTISPIQSAISTEDPDPFDPLQSDPKFDDAKPDNDTFRLVPLIYVAGPDRVYDIWRRDELDRTAFDGNDALVNYSFPSPEANQVNDPYWGWGLDMDTVPSVGFRLDTGGDGFEGYFDNLDNHFGLED